MDLGQRLDAAWVWAMECYETLMLSVACYYAAADELQAMEEALTVAIVPYGPGRDAWPHAAYDAHLALELEFRRVQAANWRAYDTYVAAYDELARLVAEANAGPLAGDLETAPSHPRRPLGPCHHCIICVTLATLATLTARSAPAILATLAIIASYACLCSAVRSPLDLRLCMIRMHMALYGCQSAAPPPPPATSQPRCLNRDDPDRSGPLYGGVLRDGDARGGRARCHHQRSPHPTLH
jgi:hypothetical protein